MMAEIIFSPSNELESVKENLVNLNDDEDNALLLALLDMVGF
jgi:hypothetical protein